MKKDTRLDYMVKVTPRSRSDFGRTYGPFRGRPGAESVAAELRGPGKSVTVRPLSGSAGSVRVPVSAPSVFAVYKEREGTVCVYRDNQKVAEAPASSWEQAETFARKTARARIDVFTPSEAVRHIRLVKPPATPRVGDRMTVTHERDVNKGKSGRVVDVSSYTGDRTYRLRFADGSEEWYRPEHMRLRKRGTSTVTRDNRDNPVVTAVEGHRMTVSPETGRWVDEPPRERGRRVRLD